MILGVVQARMSSTRLPAKVLLEIKGRPLLEILHSRLQNSQCIDEIIIATSQDISDDQIELWCKKNGVKCFRGSLENVLERYYQCALIMTPDHIVRITADCPLIDPVVVDQVIRAHLDHDADYTSNTLEPTFPDGLDVEVMTLKALECAYKNAILPSHREHVTKYIYDNPKLFKLNSFKQQHNYSSLRWTVDTYDDFQVVSEIINHFVAIDKVSYQEILGLYQDLTNRILNLNSQYARNAGMLKSLEQDRLFMEQYSE